MSNIEVLSAVHGIAPRSDELLLLGTDLEKSRVSQSAFDEQLQAEGAAWLALQTDAGIDITEDGKLAWQDHLRPIVAATTGFKGDPAEAPVTRWYQTNRFYRRPTITGPLLFDSEYFDSVVKPLTDNMSLVCPKTFASLCDNEYAELSPDDNVLGLYRQLLSHLGSQGIKRITLENYERDTQRLFETNSYIDLAERLRSEFPELTLTALAINQPGGIIPVDGSLGVDPSLNSLTFMTRLPGTHTLPLGLKGRPDFTHREVWNYPIDSSEVRVDEFDPQGWPLHALRSLHPARIVLTHTVDFEQLPLPYAQEKVRRLGEVSLQLRNYLEENL